MNLLQTQLVTPVYQTRIIAPSVPQPVCGKCLKKQTFLFNLGVANRKKVPFHAKVLCAAHSIKSLIAVCQLFLWTSTSCSILLLLIFSIYFIYYKGPQNKISLLYTACIICLYGTIGCDRSGINPLGCATYSTPGSVLSCIHCNSAAQQCFRRMPEEILELVGL